MHVRCPHCHNPIEIVDDSSFKEIPCPTCGSSFSLVAEAETTAAYHDVLRTIGHFELIERLGIGAFGAVWKARDTKLDRIVAVKIPRKDLLTEAETEQFLREARAAAQLRHPNVVTVHEVGRDGDSLFIVSDYVDGLTLSDWLTGQQPTVRTAVELCAKIADALHAAHEQRVVHRDLKPSNIILDRDNEPHVMDFGLAKREAGEITMTAEGQVLGTPAYMAPEQARGEAHTADRRADVYALGVILFELLTGEKPFRGNARMLIHQVLTEEAPSPRKLNSNVPKDIETVALKCLEKSPDARFPTAKDLGHELRRFLAGEPIHSRPISRAQRAWRWCRRNPQVTTLSLVIAVTLCTGMGVSTYLATLANHRAWETRMWIITNTSALSSLLSGLRDDASPDSYELIDLGAHLLERSALTLRQRIRSNPNDSLARGTLIRTLKVLGNIRFEQGSYVDAEVLLRECLSYHDPTQTSIHPGVPAHARFLLGSSLVGQQRLDEAEPLLIDGFEEMESSDVDDDSLTKAASQIVQLYNNWSRTDELNQWKGILESLGSRVSIRLPNKTSYYNSLGYTHRFRCEWSDAIDAHEKVLSTAHGYSVTYAHMGQAKRLAQLDANLPSVSRGELTPVTAAEWAEYAKLCDYKRLYHQSVNFYLRAFSDDEDYVLRDSYGYHAACMAALAASGRGAESASTDAERADLRRLALHWLQADFARWTKWTRRQTVSMFPGIRMSPEESEVEARQARATFTREMRGWKLDDKLASIRDKDELLGLPAGERIAFEQLWSRVDSVLTPSSR